MTLTVGSLAQPDAAPAEGMWSLSLSSRWLIVDESPVCQRILQGDASLRVKLHHLGKQVQGVLTGLHNNEKGVVVQRQAPQDSALQTGSERPCWPAAAMASCRRDCWTSSATHDSLLKTATRAPYSAVCNMNMPVPAESTLLHVVGAPASAER